MSDEYDGPTIPGNPSGYIVGAINEGTSATSALNAYRGDGGSIRTQTWYRLFGEVSNALASEPAAAALDPYQLPSASDYAQWSMGPGGEYVTSVRVFFKDQDTGLIGSKLYDYKTAEPHTPFEAQLAAETDYFSPENTEIGQSGEGQQFLMTTIHNVYFTTPYGG